MLARQIEHQLNSQPKSWFPASERVVLDCHLFGIETADSRTKRNLRWPRLNTTS
jgi:hypothetical protein